MFDDGPQWITPSVGFCERDAETGQAVVKVSFTLPFAHLDKFFDTITSPAFRTHFEAGLNDILAENMDDISAVMGVA